MSKMLRKKLISAEFLVASSLLLAPGLALTGYGQNTPQSSPPPTPQTTPPSTPQSSPPSCDSLGYPTRGIDSSRPIDRPDYAGGESRQH